MSLEKSMQGRTALAPSAVENPAGPAGPHKPSWASVALGELRQWGTPSEEASGGPSETTARAQMSLRLERLELTADAAAQRFELLQSEYHALRQKHTQLKQRHRARSRGRAEPIRQIEHSPQDHDT